MIDQRAVNEMTMHISQAEEGNEELLTSAVEQSSALPAPDCTVEWDVERLKKLIVVLKKKYEIAIASLNTQEEENGMLKGQQLLLRQLLDEAQREGEKLRMDIERCQSELAQREETRALATQYEEIKEELLRVQTSLRTFQRDKELLQELLSEEQQNSELCKSRLDKLGQAIKERDKRIADLSHFEYSCRKAHEQRQQVENQLETIISAKQVLEAQHRELQQEAARRHQQMSSFETERREWQQTALKAERQQREIHELKLRAEKESVAMAAARDEVARTQRLLQDTREEAASFQEQFKQLKARTIAVQQELKLKEGALLEAHQIIEQIKFENQRMQRELHEAGRRFVALQNELRTSQESEEEWKKLAGEREKQLTELHSEFENLSLKNAYLIGLESVLEDEMVWRRSAEEKLVQQENSIVRLSEEKVQGERFAEELRATLASVEVIAARVPSLESELEECGKREEEHRHCVLHHKATEEQLKTALQTIAALEKREGIYCTALEEEKQSVARLQEQIDMHSCSIERLREQLRLLEGELQERDAAIKLGQHHFAKKVKEYILLEERCGDLQEVARRSDWNVEELNRKFEEQRQCHHQREEEHLEEKHQLEELVREWEKQCSHKDEVLQESERRCQLAEHRLGESEKQLEKNKLRLEKYMQVEIILKSLSVGTPQVNFEQLEPLPSPPPPLPQKPVEVVSLEQPVLNETPLFHEVFAVQAGSSRHKENLFD